MATNFWPLQCTHLRVHRNLKPLRHQPGLLRLSPRRLHLKAGT